MVQIVFTKTAEKSFLKLPIEAKKKITKAVEKLSQDPFKGEKLKGEFAGQYKLYAWLYRVIYLYFAESNTVTIVELGHRQGIYK